MNNATSYVIILLRSEKKVVLVNNLWNKYYFNKNDYND